MEIIELLLGLRIALCDLFDHLTAQRLSGGKAPVKFGPRPFLEQSRGWC
jgi:hypothetical protein